MFGNDYDYKNAIERSLAGSLVANDKGDIFFTSVTGRIYQNVQIPLGEDCPRGKLVSVNAFEVPIIEDGGVAILIVDLTVLDQD